MSTSKQQSGKWGSLELVSAPQIEAGELASIHPRYIAGSAGLTPGGTVSITTNSDSDWPRHNSATRLPTDFCV